MRPPARADPEAFASRALGFRDLAADSSSLIVLAEIGLLASALARWRLSTTAAVAAELRAGDRGEGCGEGRGEGCAADGRPDAGRQPDSEAPFGAVRVVEEQASPALGADGKPLSADAGLVSLAARLGLPVLSEDGRILRAAEERGLDCLDSLVAVELLAAAGSITGEQAEDGRRLIRARSIISPARAAWAGAVGLAAEKFG